MFVAAGLMSILAAPVVTKARAQDPVQQPPQQAAAPAQEDPLKFNRDGRVLILWEILPGREMDFELSWRTIKEHLKTTGNAELSQFADGIRILKHETVPGLYMFDLNPPSKTYSYNPVTLLYETLKEDPAKPGIGLTYDQATEIYDKIKDCYKSINPWPLTDVR
jgi:hypothetical protein